MFLLKGVIWVCSLLLQPLVEVVVTLIPVICESVAVVVLTLPYGLVNYTNAHINVTSGAQYHVILVVLSLAYKIFVTLVHKPETNQTTYHSNVPAKARRTQYIVGGLPIHWPSNHTVILTAHKHINAIRETPSRRGYQLQRTKPIIRTCATIRVKPQLQGLNATKVENWRTKRLTVAFRVLLS